jgi:hypothetical protein
VASDPTPPDLRLAGADALRGTSSLSEIASALELWWFQNIVDFDRSTQARALRDLWMRWNGWQAERRQQAPRLAAQGDEPRDAEREIPWAWLAGGAFAAFAALRVRRHQRRRAGASLPPDYARALRLLRRRGLARAPAASARAFAREVSAQIPEDGARAFDALTEAYLAERFGSAQPASGAHELAALRASLRERGQRARN